MQSDSPEEDVPAPERQANSPPTASAAALIAAVSGGTTAASSVSPVSSQADLGLGAPPAYSSPNNSTGSLRGTSARRSSYNERTNPAGTIMRAADLGSGMDTVRPVKRVDAAGSLRMSADYMGSIKRAGSSSGPTSPTSSSGESALQTPAPAPASPGKLVKPHPRRSPSEIAKAGVAMIDDVVVPTLQNTIRDDMDAREIESLSMLVRGFQDLREANPELAYNVVLDVLSGINEYVPLVQFVRNFRS